MKLLWRLYALCLFTTSAFGFDSFNTTVVDTTAPPRWYIPNYIPVQFAGNMGFLSTGAGYCLARGRARIGLTYGYSPASLSEKPVHLITCRASARLFDISVKRHPVTPYADVGCTIETGGISFMRVPSRFPKNYYYSNAVHFSICLGVRTRIWSGHSKTFPRAIEAFGELGTQDVFLYSKLTQKEVPLARIVNLALGVNLMLK